MVDNHLLRDRLFSACSDVIKERADRSLQELSQADFQKLVGLGDLTVQQWHQVTNCSQFALEQIIKNPLILLDLEKQVARSWHRSDYQRELDAYLADVADEKMFDKKLRLWRNAMMVRSIWRDLNRLAPTLEITEELSHMADCAIETALRFLYQGLCKTRGIPTNLQGQEQALFILGMGKLGAFELNLSSDIDLIFAYPEAGETRSARSSISNQEFFTELGQKLIKTLGEQTVDGFVFRVDMRLRPYGQSGPLVSHFDALEKYYLTQGRDWERYAMVKARVVASSLPDQQSAQTDLMTLLNQFTYRRYVDFTVVEALRDLKTKILQEVKRRRLKNNVKLGEGGIREVEFIVQAMQLIRGGRDTELQTPSLAKAMRALVALTVLPRETADQLLENYCFLRDMEHAIQAWQDQQTQDLPQDPAAQQALVLAMQAGSWPELLDRLERAMADVSQHFAKVIARRDSESQQLLPSSWKDLWFETRPEFALPLLEKLGIAESSERQHIFDGLSALRVAPQVLAADKTGSERLHRLIPHLLHALVNRPKITQSKVTQSKVNRPNAAQTLARLQPLILAIVRRSAYVLLLLENHTVLEQLVVLSEASPWIPERLAQHPALLDELLNPASFYQIPDKFELESELQQQMLRIPEDDLEQQMESLRYFRQAHGLKVAACEVTGRLPLMKVSDYLTHLAEVVINRCLSLAWREMTHKHGLPGGQNDSEPHFIIVGYGKLGGIELGHGSDLDLVFIHDADVHLDTQAREDQRALDNQTFYTRLGQKLIHLLGTNTPSGILYAVDMRLRPSGNSGLLVSNLAAFARYQENSAWTWEHQALVRARVVAGYAPLASAFEQIRQQTLAQQRDLPNLKREVVDMRQKMRQQLGTRRDEKAAGQFHLKQDAGGIVDIEFIVQYLVLAHAHQHPELTGWSDNIRILEAVANSALLEPEQAAELIEAYKSLRSETHKLALQESAHQKVDAADFSLIRAKVQAIWHAVLGIS